MDVVLRESSLNDEMHGIRPIVLRSHDISIVYLS